MKKKLLAMLIVGVMGASLLTGCGGSDDAAATQAPAQEATQTESKTEEKTETTAETNSSELTFEDLQDNYAILVDCYNQVEELYMNDQIEQDDDIESLLTEAKGIIDEMGEATEDDFGSEQDLQDMNDAMATMIDALGQIVDGITETGSGESEDDIIAQLKNTLTLGYAGGSESGEELYLATDDNIDIGILGIVNNGDATFLAGDITESNGELTITDSQTGDSLTFTVEEDTDDEGTPVLIINITSNGAVGALYSVDASDVIDAMSQY